MNSQLVFLILLFIPITVVIAFVPYLTRKTENFGVSIPESMYDRGNFKAMRKKYTATVIVVGLMMTVLLIILGLLVSPTAIAIIYSVMVFIFLIGSFLIYLPFHYKMKKIKLAENWQVARTQSLVVDMKFRQEKLTYSNWWFIIPAIITVATIVLTFVLYDDIPENLPMHTDFSGNITYDEKSIKTILFIPATQMFFLILFVFINVIIRKTKQQVSVENPEKSKQQNIIFRRRWSAYIICTSILMILMFMYTQLSFIFPTLDKYNIPVMYTAVALIIIGTFVLAFFTGQGGSRVKIDDKNNENVIDRDDDKYWKLGQFYVNKNDPAIFIEKRFGVGWTNNWAHPISWVFVALILLVIIIPIILFS